MNVTEVLPNRRYSILVLGEGHIHRAFSRRPLSDIRLIHVDGSLMVKNSKQVDVVLLIRGTRFKVLKSSQGSEGEVLPVTDLSQFLSRPGSCS